MVGIVNDVDDTLRRLISNRQLYRRQSAPPACLAHDVMSRARRAAAPWQRVRSSFGTRFSLLEGAAECCIAARGECGPDEVRAAAHVCATTDLDGKV
jgi:hypothetical protein